MKLWKNVSGYVIIDIMGKYPERLVNRCAGEGIPLFDCEKLSGAVRASVAARDFPKLRPLARGAGVRVRIVSRHGLVRARRQLGNCAAFAAFLLLAAVLTAAASTRLWFIDVDTVSVPEEDIRAALSDLGAVPGVPKRSIRTAELSRALALDTRIVNAKVKLAGVVLTVTISGADAMPEKEEGDEPADIVADRDCVITYISVTRGRAETAKGRAVRAGDVLIRGILPDVAEGYAVRAEGVIYGETVCRVSATAAPVRTSRIRSGRCEKAVSALLFGREIMLFPPFEDYELEPAASRVMDAGALPLTVREYLAYELVTAEVEDTPEGTRERARLMAQEKLKDALPETARIRSILTDCRRNADGSVTATLTVTAVERIGALKK